MLRIKWRVVYHSKVPTAADVAAKSTATARLLWPIFRPHVQHSLGADRGAAAGAGGAGVASGAGVPARAAAFSRLYHKGHTPHTNTTQSSRVIRP